MVTPATSADALASLGQYFAKAPGLLLEWSLRVQAGGVSTDDRFTIWLEAMPGAAAPFEPVVHALASLDAPASVLAAQREAVPVSIRQGISVSYQAGSPEWRLYLHTHPAGALQPTYHSYRWARLSDVETDEYFFHYLPATPEGQTPDSLVHPACATTVRALLEHPRLQSLSGFWLRQRAGATRQVDLTYPWHPSLTEFAAPLSGLCTTLGAPTHWLERYAEHPIRHLAFSGPRSEPVLTVYFSAPISSGDWPTSLVDLQTLVCIHSQQVQREVEHNLFSRLPSTSIEPNRTVGEFYDTTNLAAWQHVLGQEMHYHFGLFDLAAPLAPQSETAFAASVTRLYPHIGRGSRVYDLGCGWGGPARQLIRDLGCQVEGITASRSQYAYCSGLGLLVRHGDMEMALPSGPFDVLLMLESLSHVRDKLRLLKVLRVFGKRLILREHCQNASPPSVNFGGTMYMNSSLELRNLLFTAGWKITRWRNRRPESMPSVQIWHQRLQDIPPTNDTHLETLRAFCAHVFSYPDEWAANNPLMEVVAE
jgi:cyclopropane fatty-acyl-phospholipid synthase-like methyltransferase